MKGRKPKIATPFREMVLRRWPSVYAFWRDALREHNISQHTVYQWCWGLQIPTGEHLAILSEALGVSAQEIVDAIKGSREIREELEVKK